MSRCRGRRHRMLACRVDRAVLVLVVLFVARTGVGQDPEPPPSPADPVPEAFESPAATLRTFVEAMADEDRARAAACLDLSLVAADGAGDRAQELYRCINRIEYIDFRSRRLRRVDATNVGDLTTWTYFPDDSPRASARARRVARLVPDARIVLKKMPEGEWKFSAETVKGGRAFWERLRESGLEVVDELRGEERLTFAERLEAMWPEPLVRSGVLGVRYWQWITLFAVILVGIILDFTTRFVLTTVWGRAIRARGGSARRETMRRTVRPFGLTVAALLWLWAVRLLGLPDEALQILIPAVKLFAMLAVVWSAYRVTDLLGEVASSKASRSDTKFDDLLVPLVRKALKVLITIFGLIYIANSLRVPIAPLLTGLGIGGAGFAFAAKDTLEHFFGSVTVIADRPFEVGDWVQIGDVEGTVEAMGFRSTRVRTFYNSVVSVPNGNLVRAVVDNYGRRRYRRWKTHLNITYDTPPETIESFCEGIRTLVREHPCTRKDYYQVWLHQFGPHSLDVLLYIFLETPDWQTELQERHRLMLDIIRLADRQGVEFAFPTRTVVLEEAKGSSD